MVSLEKLDAANFSQFHRHIDNLCKIFEKEELYPLAEALCFSVAAHYKHLAQIDGIREEARKEAEYFLQKGLGYKKIHNFFSI